MHSVTSNCQLTSAEREGAKEFENLSQLLMKVHEVFFSFDLPQNNNKKYSNLHYDTYLTCEEIFSSSSSSSSELDISHKKPLCGSLLSLYT